MTLPPTWDLFGEDHIPHHVLLLAKMLDRETSRQLQAEFDLKLAEWRVLAFACSKGPASAADVCAAFEVDRAEVSRAVASLQDSGLIERTADGENRRRLILVPTEQGQNLFQAARARRQDYFHEVMSTLDDSERRALAASLRKLAFGVARGRGDEDDGRSER